jgi:hypothetical protein
MHTLRSRRSASMRAVNGPPEFVWYGVRGFARLGGVGGGGLIGASPETLEVVSFRRRSAEAIFATPTDERIKVASHRPQTGEAFNRLRDTAVSNALNRVPVEDRRGVVRALDEPGPASVHGVTWEEVELTVEGTPRPFDVCRSLAYSRSAPSGTDPLAGCGRGLLETSQKVLLELTGEIPRARNGETTRQLGGGHTRRQFQ